MTKTGRRLVPRLLAAYVLALGVIAVAAVFAAPGAGELAALITGGLAGGGVIWALGRRWQRTIDQLIEEAADRATRAQADQRRSEEERRLLEQVLAVVRQGVVLVGENDEVAYANPAARELVKLSERLATLIPHGLQRLVRQARLNQEVAQEDLEHGSPVRTLRAAAIAFPDDKRVLLTITDVTDSNRIESIRRDFVAAASHELKTPVAAVQASAEAMLLALSRDTGSAQRFALQVERSAHQLARLVNDLLDLSRVESSIHEVEPVEVHGVVEGEVAGLRQVAEEAGVGLSVQAAPVRVMGSSQDLGLVVRNLLDNAIRHTARGGSVTVTVSDRDGFCNISVRDTGEGIPRRELPRIFERFYRVDTARARATGGTGLGLAIVKHVVERHAGTVSVESELGVGSTFRIELPKAGP